MATRYSLNEAVIAWISPMESFGEEKDRPVVPPPFPAAPAKIDYFHEPPGSREWVVVASLPTIGAWYSVKVALDRHRIVSRMNSGGGDSTETELLVLLPDANRARAVLRGIRALGRQIVIVGDLPGAQDSRGNLEAIPAEPIASPALSDRPTNVLASIILVFCWIMVIGLILLIVLAYVLYYRRW